MKLDCKWVVLNIRLPFRVLWLLQSPSLRNVNPKPETLNRAIEGSGVLRDSEQGLGSDLGADGFKK